MKRFIALWFILLFILCSAAAESESGFMYAISEDYIWKYCDGRIEITTVDGEKAGGFDCDLVERIAATQDTILVGRHVGQAHELAEYDRAGNLVGEWALPDGFMLLQIEALDGQVFLLGGEMQADAHDPLGEIYTLNRETGALSSWQPASGGEYHFFSASSGKLVALNPYRSGLTVFDLSTNAVSELTLRINLDYFWPDRTGEGCVGYAIRGNSIQLMWIDLETGASSVLTDLGSNLFAGMRGNAKGIYIKDVTKNELLFFPWTALQRPSDPVATLTLVNAFDVEGGRMTRAIDLFHSRHPDVEIIFRNSDNDVQLAAQMMAGDSGVDIVFVQERGGMCARAVYQSGALVDLSQNDELMGNLAHWYDVSGLISSGDAIYGVPSLIWPYAWYVNGELLDELGWEIPERGWTWEDFFALGRELAQYNQSEGTRYKLLADTEFSYLLRQYNYNEIDIEGGKADFDNEVYRNLVSQWVEMAELDVLESVDPFSADAIPENSVFSVQFSTYLDLCTPGVNLVYPPVYAEDTRYPVFTITGVLNANSPNREVAEDFLACYVSPEAIVADPVGDVGRFLKNDADYPAESLNPAVPYSALTSENTAYWVDMLTNGVAEFWYGDIERIQQMELYPQLLSGEINVDQYVRILQQRADMALGE